MEGQRLSANELLVPEAAVPFCDQCLSFSGTKKTMVPASFPVVPSKLTFSPSSLSQMCFFIFVCFPT